MSVHPPLTSSGIALVEEALAEIASCTRAVEHFKTTVGPFVCAQIEETLDQVVAAIDEGSHLSAHVEPKPWGRYNLGVWPKNTAMADALIFSVVVDPVQEAVICGGWDASSEWAVPPRVRPVPGWTPADLSAAIAEWLRVTRRPKPLKY
jgi:hypothetical protein